MVVTVRGPKPFSWSYSRLKNYEACPSKHYHVDIVKDSREADSESLLWGNAVHKALARRIEDGTPLPKGMTHYEPWVAKITAGEGAQFLVEQQLAIDADFLPTKWFSETAWYRGIADVIKLMGPVALVIDYKTGKVIEDSQQLFLMAACVFAHHPQVQKIRTEFVWLKENASSRENFSREDMPQHWRQLWPRIEQLKHAHEAQEYPAKPGGLCRNWCPVKVCPHHGERN